MMVVEELKLEAITANYYDCNLYKLANNVVLDFGNVKLHFLSCLIFKCGYPNEEVYKHYNYYTQGSMRKHCLYEIQQSDWIKDLMKFNMVHVRHTDEIFKDERHFILLFEDEVFECIAASYQITVV